MTMGEGSITVAFPNTTVKVSRSALGSIVNLSLPSGLATWTSCRCTRCDLRLLGGCDCAWARVDEKLGCAKQQNAPKITSTLGRKRCLFRTVLALDFTVCH